LAPHSLFYIPYLFLALVLLLQVFPRKAAYSDDDLLYLAYLLLAYLLGVHHRLLESQVQQCVRVACMAVDRIARVVKVGSRAKRELGDRRLVQPVKGVTCLRRPWTWIEIERDASLGDALLSAWDTADCRAETYPPPSFCLFDSCLFSTAILLVSSSLK
jgi:hypothetical protein